MKTEKILTESEIEYVLAKYVGCYVDGYNSGAKSIEVGNTIKYHNISGLAERIQNNYGKIHLIPIQKISDEDAIEVATIISHAKNMLNIGMY